MSSFTTFLFLLELWISSVIILWSISIVHSNYEWTCLSFFILNFLQLYFISLFILVPSKNGKIYTTSRSMLFLWKKTYIFLVNKVSSLFYTFLPFLLINVLSKKKPLQLLTKKWFFLTNIQSPLCFWQFCFILRIRPHELLSLILCLIMKTMIILLVSDDLLWSIQYSVLCFNINLIS